MNECINAYKPKNKSKNAENELEIINLFKNRQERYRKAVRKFNEKKAKEKNSNNNKCTDY